MHSNSATGHRMHRDPRDPQVIDTSDSTARARDYMIRERAAFLDSTFLIDLPGFDSNFLRFYAQDRDVILFLSAAAATRARELVGAKEMQ